MLKKGFVVAAVLYVAISFYGGFRAGVSQIIDDSVAAVN